MGQEPLRKAYDGVTYFGCTATMHEPARSAGSSLEGSTCLNDGATGGPSKSVQHQFKKTATVEILNDYIIPVKAASCLASEEEEEKHAGR